MDVLPLLPSVSHWLTRADGCAFTGWNVKTGEAALVPERAADPREAAGGRYTEAVHRVRARSPHVSVTGECRMNWVMLAVGAALSWGLYGPMLHKGQVALGSPMRALLCVGVAYLLVAILIPGGTLVSQGELHGFNGQG